MKQTNPSLNLGTNNNLSTSTNKLNISSKGYNANNPNDSQTKIEKKLKNSVNIININKKSTNPAFSLYKNKLVKSPKKNFKELGMYKKEFCTSTESESYKPRLKAHHRYFPSENLFCQFQHYMENSKYFKRNKNKGIYVICPSSTEYRRQNYSWNRSNVSLDFQKGGHTRNFPEFKGKKSYRSYSNVIPNFNYRL